MVTYFEFLNSNPVVPEPLACLESWPTFWSRMEVSKKWESCFEVPIWGDPFLLVPYEVPLIFGNTHIRNRAIVPFIYVYIYIRICIYRYMYIYIYIHVYIPEPGPFPLQEGSCQGGPYIPTYRPYTATWSLELPSTVSRSEGVCQWAVWDEHFLAWLQK